MCVFCRTHVYAYSVTHVMYSIQTSTHTSLLMFCFIIMSVSFHKIVNGVEV